VLFNYGHLEYDQNFAINTAFIPDVETYYVKAGLRRRWHPLGHTIFYGEYLKNDDGGVTSCAGAAGNFCTSTDLDVWGLGVVQEIDAAAMSMWLAYRHGEFDDNSVGVFATDYEDLDWLRFGALINF